MEIVYIVFILIGGLILTCFICLYLWLVFFPTNFIETGFKLGAKKSGFSVRKVNISGITWSYLIKNSPMKEPDIFVFIHGFSGCKESWFKLCKHLKNSCLVLLDLPGHGTSSAPSDSNYRIHRQVERLEELLIAILGQSYKIHLVGVSMGGLISGVFAATYPHRVETLTLICPAGISMPHKSKLVMVYEESGRNLLHVQNGEDLEELLDYIFHKPPRIPRYFLDWIATFRAKKNHIYEKVFDDLLLDKQLLEENLCRILAPTLVLWGQEDKVIDVSTVDVIQAEMSFKPVISIMPKTGHGVQRESPSNCAFEISNFIREVRNPSISMNCNVINID